MTNKLYTVPVEVIATVTATVAACSPAEASQIASDEVRMHIVNMPKLMTLTEHAITVRDPVEVSSPARRYRVDGIFQLNFEVEVPAADGDDAVLHARRLYDVAHGPFEFKHDGGGVTRLVAEEVRS